MCLRDAVGVVVRKTPRSDQTLVARRLERRDRVAEWRRLVRLVREIEVDAVDSEPLETALELPANPIRREPGVARRPGGGVEDLRRQLEAFGTAGHRQAPIQRSLVPPP